MYLLIVAAPPSFEHASEVCLIVEIGCICRLWLLRARRCCIVVMVVCESRTWLRFLCLRDSCALFGASVTCSLSSPAPPPPYPYPLQGVRDLPHLRAGVCERLPQLQHLLPCPVRVPYVLVVCPRSHTKARTHTPPPCTHAPIQTCTLTHIHADMCTHPSGAACDLLGEDPGRVACACAEEGFFVL